MVAAPSIWDIQPPSTPDPVSKAAAASIVGVAGTLRRNVFLTVSAMAPVAEWQIEHTLQLAGNTVRPRIWELMKAGLIERTEERGRTPSGRSCYLYVISEKGRAAL